METHLSLLMLEALLVSESRGINRNTDNDSRSNEGVLLTETGEGK